MTHTCAHMVTHLAVAASLIGLSSSPLHAQQRSALAQGGQSLAPLEPKFGLVVPAPPEPTMTCAALDSRGVLKLSDIQTIATNIAFELKESPALPPDSDLTLYVNNCGQSNLSGWLDDVALYVQLVLGCIDANEYADAVESPFEELAPYKEFISVVREAVRDALPSLGPSKIAPISQNVAASALFFPALTRPDDVLESPQLDGPALVESASSDCPYTPEVIPYVSSAWLLVYAPTYGTCDTCELAGSNADMRLQDTTGKFAGVVYACAPKQETTCD